jgi:phosphoglycolate phosphatase-like HAD superfamily hydrolase
MDGLVLATAEDDTTRERIVEAAVQRAKATWSVPRYQRVVLIGDAPWDVQAARRLALPFLGVGVEEKAQRLLAEGAGTVMADFRDIPAVLALLDETELPRKASEDCREGRG